MREEHIWLCKRVNRSGLPRKFLARRLYKLMGYPSPATAENFIRSENWHPGGYYLRMDEFSRTERKNLAILLYAIGTPKDHVEVQALIKQRTRYPPRKGISYKKLWALRQAMLDPASADPKLLSQLEPDEKLEISDPKELEKQVDELIRQGKVRKETKIQQVYQLLGTWVDEAKGAPQERIDEFRKDFDKLEREVLGFSDERRKDPTVMQYNGVRNELIRYSKDKDPEDLKMVKQHYSEIPIPER
jgi:hypothetical protein